MLFRISVDVPVCKPVPCADGGVVILRLYLFGESISSENKAKQQKCATDTRNASFRRIAVLYRPNCIYIPQKMNVCSATYPKAKQGECISHYHTAKERRAL